MQDFTGVPCVVDLATMREAVQELGGDPARINPLAPAELVIDHSVIADLFGAPDSFERNVELEYERNAERYQFLRWGQTAFDDFKVVPPGTGIVHQVNIEYLARVVFERDGVAYPDTLVGTDSHTTMVNGLGVLGWGVGGIEAEAAMLGQPVSMLIPKVVGFKLVGELPEGATATDLVLTITEMLRKHGVVGKFVEFYGEGVAAVPLANRATIGNMSPEYGSTVAIFPIDDETVRYLRMTGRDDQQVALVEAYAKAQGLWHDPAAEPAYSETIELDLSTVVPSIAGPKRPQDRVSLSDAKAGFRDGAGRLRRRRRGGRVRGSTRRRPSRSRPATRPAVRRDNGGRRAARRARARRAAGRPSNPAKVSLDGQEFEVDHGHVVIAAITSCTNTSNPSVMIGAALVAKKAVERGLTRKPWVKTTLAPGSKVVMDYYERAGLTPYLDKLGFNLVGYGCTTCIGNSGPLQEPISKAVNDNDLAVVSVLSGNRNFEGRINPDVKMNYLMSPPLVVAYALAGSMDIDITTEPLGQDADGADVFLRTSGRRPRRSRRSSTRRSPRRCSAAATPTCSPATSGGQTLPTPDGRRLRVGRRLDVRAQAAVLRGDAGRPRAGHRHRGRPGARGARRLGDHRPHLAGRLDQGRLAGRGLPARARRRPAGLQLLRVPARQPRGDDPRHLRQHPAAQPARSRRPRAASPATSPPAARSPPSTTPRSTTRPPAPRWSSSRARSTAPGRRATGPPRAPRCSACGPSSPSRTSGSTART